MCATVKPTSIAPIHKYLVSLMCTLIHPVFNAFIHRSTHERKYVEYSTTVNSTLDRATFSRMILQDISPCGFLSVNSTRSVDFLFFAAGRARHLISAADVRYLFAHFEVLPGERRVLGKLVAVIKKKTKTRMVLADRLKYIDWVLVLWGDPYKKHIQACTCPRMSLWPGTYNVPPYIYVNVYYL